MHSESLVHLSKAPALVEKIRGDRVAVQTIYRWVQRGLKGVKLRTLFAGGHRRTNELWIREFFDAVTRAADGDATVAAPMSKSREVYLRRIDRELDEAGI